MACALKRMVSLWCCQGMPKDTTGQPGGCASFALALHAQCPTVGTSLQANSILQAFPKTCTWLLLRASCLSLNLLTVSRLSPVF